MRPVLALLAFAATLGGCDGSRAEEAIAQPVVAVAGVQLAADRVVDEADLIPAAAEAALARRLEDLERRTTDQLVVVTLRSLGGETIQQVGLKLGNGWGIGQREKNNGILLIVAPAERQVRIETGKGLTDRFSDARAQQIVDAAILPHFRQGAMEGGIEAGVDAIVETLTGIAAPALDRRAA